MWNVHQRFSRMLKVHNFWSGAVNRRLNMPFAGGIETNIYPKVPHLSQGWKIKSWKLAIWDLCDFFLIIILPFSLRLGELQQHTRLAYSGKVLLWVIIYSFKRGINHGINLFISPFSHIDGAPNASPAVIAISMQQLPESYGESQNSEKVTEAHFTLSWRSPIRPASRWTYTVGIQD